MRRKFQLNPGNDRRQAIIDIKCLPCRANLANVAVNSGDARGHVYVSIAWLTGSGYADKLYGSTDSNQLWHKADIIAGRLWGEAVFPVRRLYSAVRLFRRARSL